MDADADLAHAYPLPPTTEGVTATWLSGRIILAAEKAHIVPTRSVQVVEAGSIW